MVIDIIVRHIDRDGATGKAFTLSPPQVIPVTRYCVYRINENVIVRSAAT
jgi:hypothetical protein